MLPESQLSAGANKDLRDMTKKNSPTKLEGDVSKYIQLPQAQEPLVETCKIILTE